jgi:hypothetical protein
MAKRMSEEERRAMFARLRKGKVSPMRRTKPFDPFEYHKLRIAKKTLLMPDEILGVIGGMTKEQAQAIVDKNRRHRASVAKPKQRERGGVSPLEVKVRLLKSQKGRWGENLPKGAVITGDLVDPSTIRFGMFDIDPKQTELLEGNACEKFFSKTVSPMAKTRVWKKDGNHMVFDSPHKGFNKQVDGISSGNVMGDVQLSGFVRPYNATECNGFTNPKGHLQEYDLNWLLKSFPNYVKNYVRENAKDKNVIGYEFRHWVGDKKVVHGYVVTDANHKLMKAWYSPNEKSRAVVDEAIKYITE